MEKFKNGFIEKLLPRKNIILLERNFSNKFVRRI